MKLQHKLQNLIRFCALLVGVSIFFITLNRMGGVDAVVQHLIGMRWYVLVIMANSFVWMLCYTAGWRRIFLSLKRQVHFWGLLRVKICGEGVNVLTPFGFVAGDPVRVLLLERLTGPGGRLHSVMVDRVLHSLAAQVFCLFGIVLLWMNHVELPLYFYLLLTLLYTALPSVLIVVWISLAGGSKLGRLRRLLAHCLPHRASQKIEQALGQLEDDFGYFAAHRPSAMSVAFLWHLAGRFLMAAEIAISVFAMTGNWDLRFAVMLSALTSFVTVAFGLIPGALGVLEAMYAQFFMLHHMNPEVGIAVQCVRRLRAMFWMLIGVIFVDYDVIARYLKRRKDA